MPKSKRVWNGETWVREYYFFACKVCSKDCKSVNSDRALRAVCTKCLSRKVPKGQMNFLEGGE